ncbi:MAG TPA: signal peptidase I [Spirochaetota bacterium]|nr:signal peptidase I [Spirochaetota bacterium]HPI88100.1 signal peptidase I [Spirochaetota bacterium]HPR46415.1 signal peptidase I [Spirochaetota bacterium]
MYRYEEKTNPFQTVLKAVLLVTGGIIAGLIAGRLIFLPYIAADSSMQPNIKPGERLIICKLATPAAGDIALIKSPVEPDRVLLRRIAAKGGDTVEIRNKVIYINDKTVRFAWKTSGSDKRIFPMHFTSRDTMPAVKLDRRQFFLLCDNLDNSFDSRTFGAVNADEIIGTMIYKQ